MPFKPKKSDAQSLDVPGSSVSQLAKEMNGAPASAPDAVEKLEAAVQQQESMPQVEGGANGKAT